MPIKNKELKSTSVDDLRAKMLELKKQLMKDYTQVATGTTPKSPGQIRAAKRMIARILTLLKEKNVEEA